MKYAIIQISDGNFIVNSEGYTDLNKARMAFHGLCKNLYSEAVQEKIKEGFTVMIMNSGGGVVKIETYTKIMPPVEESNAVEEPVEE